MGRSTAFALRDLTRVVQRIDATGVAEMSARGSLNRRDHAREPTVSGACDVLGGGRRGQRVRVRDPAML